MSARIKFTFQVIVSSLYLLSCSVYAAMPFTHTSLSSSSLAHQLGWVKDPAQHCGGYYLETPIDFPEGIDNKNNIVGITGKHGLISLHGTTTIEGKVTMTRDGQQLLANKALLFRDPQTGKINAIELQGNVHLREPNTLVVARQGRLNFDTKSKSLINILYRTTLKNGRHLAGPKVSEEEIHHDRKITSLTAWGKAYEFSQNQPKVYELSRASFSTCPPVNPAWRLKASHIVINKNTGRGYATHARLLVKGLPVIYIPYFNFSIDNQRKSGFLWPRFGGSNKWGPYLLAPFYWNMAPNYDMTLTAGILSKNGIQLTDNFRYLTAASSGSMNLSVLPRDRFFADFQRSALSQYANPAAITIQPYSVTQAELNRLETASTTRKGFFWRNQSRWDKYWTTKLDVNYAGDDYYLRDFGSLNEITQNQLLEFADLNYKGPHWNFIGLVQGYQTLHPVDEAPVTNQYQRLPQLILNADYPDQPLGLEYFMNSEVAHFNILKTPGTSTLLPIGNRMHIQPGVNLPLYSPAFYINPRIQLSVTNYQLHQIADTNSPANATRTIPIFDVATGLNFTRDTSFFSHAFEQTLEPQVYYTYIPYRNQASIPIFDTTVNTLTYDQIFNYNRFSGIDRLGDANQVGLGAATRLIDQYTGLEKVRLGIGEIIYFSNRRVTYCNNEATCTDNPSNPSNYWGLSPLSGVFDYHVNTSWSFSTNAIWNPITKQIDNATVGLHYGSDDTHIINLGYSYAHNGDIFSGINTNNTADNLKLTDISFGWPVTQSVSTVGRWSQDWSQNHFQNLLAGVQYDSCCWAIQLVGGRAFTNLVNNTPQYTNDVYVQFALKGLGNIGNDPTGLLRSITGYNNQLGG